MNKAIIDNDVLGTKAEQEAKFAEFAKAQNNAEYAAVVKNIDDLVAKTTPLNYQYTCLRMCIVLTIFILLYVKRKAIIKLFLKRNGGELK